MTAYPDVLSLPLNNLEPTRVSPKASPALSHMVISGLVLTLFGRLDGSTSESSPRA